MNMDLDTPFESDCTVSGVLSFILHISRLAGIAPIKFQKVRRGWRITFSWFYFAYTILVTSLLQYFAGVLTFDTREEFTDGYEPESNTQFMRIVTILILIMQVVECFTIALTGRNRHRCYIHCIARLEQINKTFDYLLRSSSKGEIKTWFKVLFLLIHGYLGAFTEFGIYMYDTQAANGTVPLKSFYFLAVYFNVCQLQLLTIQFNLIVMRLVSTQQRLNNFLKSLLEELREDLFLASTLQEAKTHNVKKINEIRVDIIQQNCYSNNLHTPSTVKSETRKYPETLRQLINIYCSQCNMIKLLNDASGPSLLMLLLYSTTYMVMAPYFVVTVMFRTQSEVPLFKIISIVLWCSLCFGMLVSVTEPCHQSHFQLQLTKKLTDQIMRYTPRKSSALYYQVKMFRRHIILNPVSFSPMHLLKFDRKLPVAVLSTAITYLSVVINL